MGYTSDVPSAIASTARIFVDMPKFFAVSATSLAGTTS